MSRDICLCSAVYKTVTCCTDLHNAIFFKLNPSISPTNQPPPPLFPRKEKTESYIYHLGPNYNFTRIFVMNVQHIIQSIYFLPNYHVSRMSFQIILLFTYYRATPLLWVNCRFLPIITMQVLSTIFQIHCMCQCKNS